jgi:hypothetical protein
MRTVTDTPAASGALKETSRVAWPSSKAPEPIFHSYLVIVAPAPGELPAVSRRTHWPTIAVDGLALRTARTEFADGGVGTPLSMSPQLRSTSSALRARRWMRTESRCVPAGDPRYAPRVGSSSPENMMNRACS